MKKLITLTAALAACVGIFLAKTPVAEKFSLSANAAESSITKMPDDAIDFQNDSSTFKYVSQPNQGGIYYFNANKISFYKFSDNTVKTIEDYSNDYDIEDVYTDSSKIYILRRPSYSDYVLDIFNTSLEKVETSKDLSEILSEDYYASAIGVDAEGRYYLAYRDYSQDETKYGILLYSKDWKKLSSVETNDRIYCFSGFDKTNGNFYFEGYTNWIYWGYEHDTTSLKCGNVTNNKISVSSSYMDLLFQNYFYYHYDSAAMLNNEYLAWTSTLYGCARIMDSNNFNITGSTLPIVGSLNREGSEYSDYESAGTRIVYNSGNDSFVMYANMNELVEFDKIFSQLSTYSTDYPVFALINYGEDIAVIEKDFDENYYIKNLKWKNPTKITLSKTSASIKTASTVSLTASCDSEISSEFSWTSSDYSVASVSKDGVVYANKPGKAVITASTNGGIKASCTVTVTENSSITSQKYKTSTSGSKSSNISNNNYTYWSSPAYSNLYESSDGSLVRVEDTNSAILVETYSSNGKTLKSTKKIKKELSLFGGFFAGENNNYLIFGQKNSAESDSKEIMRVVKYTKSWTRVSDCKIYGSNTYIPFDAGSLRAIELDGKLYIYTCHEMYADESEPDVHHQANMLFTIDENTMKVTDSMYDVDNLSSGYVSHSFNQFIQTDGTYIYRVDHSESSSVSFNGSYLSTNGITLTKYPKNSSSTNTTVSIPVEFDIHQGNYTGASIGGFELGSSNCLIAYNLDISEDCSRRNIYVNISDNLFNKSKNIALTKYTAKDKINCSTPQMVKINENLFLIMWEEYNSSTEKTITKLTTIDSNGNIVVKAVESDVRLSDCQPKLCKDYNVKWYVTNGASPIIYSVNPYDIQAAHAHNYTAKVTKAATCKSTGVKTYTCSCGESYTKTIAKTSHKYKTSVVKPTYAAKGYTLHKCSVCGASYKDNYTAKKTVATVKPKSSYTSSTGAIRINWNKVSGASGYIVYRYNSSTKKWVKISTISSGSTLTYKDSKLKAGTVYKYKVKAFVKSGGKNYYGSSSKTICTATKPTSPKITKSSKSKNSVKLYWKKVNCSGYTIQRYDASSKKWITVKNLSSSYSNYNITKLKNNTTYKFRIRAYRSDGNKKTYSSWTTTTVKTKK